MDDRQLNQTTESTTLKPGGGGSSKKSYGMLKVEFKISTISIP